MYWQTKEQLLSLLRHLVQIPSVTGAEAEQHVPAFLEQQLSAMEYFQTHSELLKVHHHDDGSSFFTALVKKPNTSKTVILLSHFDVVGIEDYGLQKGIAFDIDRITNFYQDNPALLPEHVRTDIDTGEWVFGRGTADMKAGLAVQLSLIERAANGEFDGNLLLVSVSDEEVGSKGMLQAIRELNSLQKTHRLSYCLCVNAEPSFKEHPFDDQKYVYTGTVGKLLPTFYCAGQETHVGEPFSGLNASLMAAVLTAELELSTEFLEEVDGEQTPPLSNLMMRDLKEGYNVQTPSAAVSMFNLLYMEQSMEQIMQTLLQKTRSAASRMAELYETQARKAGITGLPYQIDVMTWKDVYRKVQGKIGTEQTEERIKDILLTCESLDEREKSIRVVQHLSSYLKEEAPFIVLFFSPPFYPAVSSRFDPLVQVISQDVIEHANKRYHVEIKKRHFFPGLCDLSYASSQGNLAGIQQLTGNMPLFGKEYYIPFDEIESLNVPVLNIGPYGADPHQKTERLETSFSFTVLPELLQHLVAKVFSY